VNKVRWLGSILVAILVVAASAVGAYEYAQSRHSQPNQTPVISDGPTLSQALSQVNATIANTTGGSWELFSVYGIASQAPFSPNVLGYVLENHTVNVCGALYDGTTLWNGTIPVFNGTFNSGTAPFWQFGFYSGATNQILVAVDVLGVPQVFAPQLIPGACYPWDDTIPPVKWSQISFPLPMDSPAAASVAWAGVSAYWSQPRGPFVEIIQAGPDMFGGLGDTLSGYIFWFERCGLAGVAGLQPVLGVSVNATGTSGGYSGDLPPGGTNCALQNSGYGASDAIYRVVPGLTSTNSSPTTTWTTVPFQVAIAYPNGTLTNDYDAWGLANWMERLTLTSSNNTSLPSGTPTCGSWVPTLVDCPSNSSGWFAVLLSEGGKYIDSYGVQPGGSVGWNNPVSALVSNQKLVLVFPSSWDPGGDNLTFSSNVANSTIVGSLIL